MDQIKTPYLDKRLNKHCVYCGSPDIETKDHVPSKVLLDRPYPENLPVVPSCRNCNNKFSIDEEYSAVLIECLKHGTCDAKSLERQNIKNILSRSPSLLNKIKLHIENPLNIEKQRLYNIIIKQAIGHIAFEFGEFCEDQPNKISIFAVSELSKDEIDEFLLPISQNKVPEIGGRNFMKGIVYRNNELFYEWIEVQVGRYLYMVANVEGHNLVRIIISDWLLCEVVW